MPDSVPDVLQIVTVRCQEAVDLAVKLRDRHRAVQQCAAIFVVDIRCHLIQTVVRQICILEAAVFFILSEDCLLYTSDAADEL